MFEDDSKPTKLVTLPEVNDSRSLEEKMGFAPRTKAVNIDTTRPNMKLTQTEKALRVQARRMALDFSAEMVTTLYNEAKTATNAHDRIDAATKLLHIALGKPATVHQNEDGSAITPNFNISFSNSVTADQPKPVISAMVEDAEDANA